MTVTAYGWGSTHGARWGGGFRVVPVLPIDGDQQVQRYNIQIAVDIVGWTSIPDLTKLLIRANGVVLFSAGAVAAGWTFTQEFLDNGGYRVVLSNGWTPLNLDTAYVCLVEYEDPGGDKWSDTWSFRTVGPFQCILVESVTRNRLKLTFNNIVYDEKAVRDGSNYEIDVRSGYGVRCPVRSVDCAYGAFIVYLTLDQYTTRNADYLVIVRNVRDLSLQTCLPT